ncbi:TRAP transporter large permease subunit [Azovibrio sp.]|uniref:TRAP transporter large permease subunit n=1 Tax=Azovibrio sp. TaxID=1872673 RepID=UPI003C739635
MDGIIGPLPGGLAIVNCIESMFFGGVSGSAVAGSVSVGRLPGFCGLQGTQA